MTGPYTPKSMEAARSDPAALDSRFDGLAAEASAAVGSSANTLRSVREQYREAYAEALAGWQALRDELATGPEDSRKGALRGQAEAIGSELRAERATLEKLEIAERTLARTWLFLERGDGSLVAEASDGLAEGDLAMRIVEAQEAERSRLAMEIHDGPAQSLTNAIFQADYIERLSAVDPAAAAAEIRVLRDLLRRELGNMRDFINQLRPPPVGELGLDGAIGEVTEHIQAMAGVTVTTHLAAPADALDDGQRTVVLRVIQEALQNVRKHAEASVVMVSTRLEDDDWTVEIRDDGRGFDVGAAAARGRRNFGLQFMRERAEMIGARFDVRSQPDGGTVVRLAIPRGART